MIKAITIRPKPRVRPFIKLENCKKYGFDEFFSYYMGGKLFDIELLPLLPESKFEQSLNPFK